MDTIPVVELENLKVTLGRREILHGITCRLGVSGKGKAIGLLGPNGAGKSTLTSNPALGELVAGRDPILVMFDGMPEQIHAASRTRISGLIMDVMLIERLGRATLGQQSDASPRH